jgi:hypothetical protein
MLALEVMMHRIDVIATNFLTTLDGYIEKEAKERLTKMLGPIGITALKKRTFKPQTCPVPGCNQHSHLCQDKKSKKWYMACVAHEDLGMHKIAQYRRVRLLSKKLKLSPKTLLKNWDRYRKQLYREKN